MPGSVQDIINGAVSAFLIAGVAVMVGRMALSNPIPWKDKKPLIEKYGLWAVNRAEAFCPHGDVACVEREARRLIETYRQRRVA
jgi:hypothetical protein